MEFVDKSIKILKTGILSVGFLLLMSSVASAATFQMNPTSGTFQRGCINKITVDIDSTGQVSNAADLVINYDPTRITIVDSNTNSPGVQIKSGNAFDGYFYNNVDTGAGVIRLSGGSQVTLNSKKVFAEIEFYSSNSATSSSFDIKYDGVGITTDSNIVDASNNNDLLTSAVDATYTFVSGQCAQDGDAPGVSYTSPSLNQNNFPVDGNVTFRLTDDLSGSDLSSYEFYINGQLYKIGYPGVSYSGNDKNYNVTINPSSNLPSNQSTVILIIGKDKAGNQVTSYNVINIPTKVLSEICPADTSVGENVKGEVCIGDGKDLNVNQVPTIITQLVEKDNDLFKDTALQGTIVEQINKQTGATGLVALLSTLFLSFNLIPLVSVPGIALQFIKRLTGQQQDNPWGTITDSVTGKPIAFVIAQLFLAGSQYKIDQTVSDLEGRYGFVISPGTYRLEIKHNEYIKFSSEITVKDGQQNYLMDVRLDPVGHTQDYTSSLINKIKDRVIKFYNRISTGLFVVGFILSLISIFVAISFLNVVVFIIYLISLVILIIPRLNRGSKYCSVINAQNNLRIPYAQVKIFDPKDWHLVDSQVTSYTGQFDFFGEDGEYGILIAARGYKFPSSKNKYPLAKNKYSSMVLVNLKKGGNKVDLYLDPIDEGVADMQSSGINLASPFGG